MYRVHPRRTSAFLVPISPPLSTIISSTALDLDATIEASYGGSGQTWANYEPDSAYNFFMGADGDIGTDDPEFIGNAGTEDAYWLMDGDDHFELVGANTAFLKDLHKTAGGSDFWICFAAQWVTPGNMMMFTTRNSGAVVGISLLTESGQNLQLVQRGDSAVTVSTSSVALDAGDGIVLASHSHSTNKTRLWINSTTKQEFAHTFNTTTTDATTKAKISDFNASLQLHNNTRLYHCSMGDEFLDDTKATAIIDHIVARHPEGRYTIL